MNDLLPLLWLVVPCYNEGSSGGDCLRLTAPKFLEEVDLLIEKGKVASDSCILFVDDGSMDDTWKIICDLSASEPRYTGISLSRNCGHQNALLAGLMEARGRCDICITLDCDGQDDIRAIGKMVDAYEGGSDVVYGVRSSREADSAFKRSTAEGFYRILEKLGADVVFNHADYRLLSSRALEAVTQFPERNLYLRGMVPLVGFSSTTVEYERQEREAGKSHYPLRKMMSLAIDGVTSLSVKPIRIITAIGIFFSALSLVAIIWAIVSALLGHTVAGWASMICVVGLIGGLQLLCLGVIGEYVGKIYIEVKHRPRFIVAERAGDTDSTKRETHAA